MVAAAVGRWGQHRGEPLARVTRVGGSPASQARPPGRRSWKGACRGNRVPDDDECGREQTRALDLRRPVRPGRRLPIT